eukprot:TRINITY_DN4249_c0_g1_i3.p1 TRINITY_DN4249_c0_g1~~TRINITY_DN4249_c0_g1_i3.p1  ORF type:complete len:310 (-),score=63.23 TRINITY_DN4249_c0_g1_i3:12-941(-)
MGNSVCKIDEGLFICGVEALQDIERLNRLGIKAILNVAQAYLYTQTRIDAPMGAPNLAEKLKRFNVKIMNTDDCESQDLSVHFEEMAEFIETNRALGGVAVHCAAGISRASTTCIAYMMLKEGMSVEAAYKKIFHVRNIVRPNAGFWRQLRDFEAVLKGRGVMLRELREDELREVDPSEEDVELSGCKSETSASDMIAQLDESAAEMPAFTSVFVTARVTVKAVADTPQVKERLATTTGGTGIVFTNVSVVDKRTVDLRAALVASRARSCEADVREAIAAALDNKFALDDVVVERLSDGVGEDLLSSVP